MSYKKRKLTEYPIVRRLRTAPVLLVLGCFAASTIAAPLVHADQFDQQIQQLQQQNSQTQNTVNGLQAQASSYQDAINLLQSQISGLQAQIDANVTQQAQLAEQIVAAQAELEHQKQILGSDIKAMYVGGQISTVEQLATSKSLSAFVDAETYRNAVQNKIQATLAQITQLQNQLKDQKTRIDQLLQDQHRQQTQLDSDQQQQTQLLSYNQSQQSQFNQQIQGNQAKIADLRRQQIAANARFIGAGGSGPACGGNYPAKWCEIAQDSVLDNWGMFNRECVSYTAFRVAASGRHMPGWGWEQLGNANQWDENATRDHIPNDSTPQAGDVAISNRGAYGHAMYVESINGDGTINISQYNAALDGRYTTRNNLDPSGLVFIHF